MDTAVNELDELDLSLVNTLQIDPRAPWTRVARALGIDPVTAARRWERLAGSGAAWITAQPGPRQSGHACVAFVEVDCAAGHALAVAHRLAAWPRVLTVEHTSGDRDLLLTVAVPDLATLSHSLLEAIGALTGVRALRSQLVTRVYAQGGDWRLRTLDAEQRAALTPAAPGPGRRPLRELTAQDRRLIVLLGMDGRTSLTRLSAELGVGISTVRRRLTALLACGDLVLRGELAQPLSGWPVTLCLWAHLPADDRDTVARLLNALPELRACLGVTGGRANLFLSVWLRSLADARRLEAFLADRAPRLTILDRGVVLQFVKRMGRILDPAGRSVRTVPMDIWTPTPLPLPDEPGRAGFRYRARAVGPGVGR
ncbi:Lrp/AsnC family transcriptional regulator [Streptomyces sp. NPDC050315]|uniref:Lrp/AsnC family transcriptional regulator n=1 Tax=Streptomyces sp. NPDC050315 TaxID=3155039 RepID=UPI00343A3B81